MPRSTAPRPRWTRLVRERVSGMTPALLRERLAYYRAEMAGPLAHSPGCVALCASRAAIVRAELRRRGEGV